MVTGRWEIHVSEITPTVIEDRIVNRVSMYMLVMAVESSTPLALDKEARLA
jgi:hypothetical protein